MYGITRIPHEQEFFDMKHEEDLFVFIFFRLSLLLLTWLLLLTRVQEWNFSHRNLYGKLYGAA